MEIAQGKSPQVGHVLGTVSPGEDLLSIFDCYDSLIKPDHARENAQISTFRVAHVHVLKSQSFESEEVTLKYCAV